MNPGDNLQPLFFQQEPSPLLCHNYKSGQKSKIAQQTLPQQNRFLSTEQPVQLSPFGPSFFFTPTSPRHFRLDVDNCDSGKQEFKTPTTEVSISKKLNFQDSEQALHSCTQDFLAKSKGFRPRKSSSSRTIRNVKGLRSLSEYVYTIAAQLGKTQYKVVAERLIEDISKNGLLYDKAKDQQNVKRRVYDALNVLIAAGILRKQGKEVSCSQSYQKGRSKFAESISARQMTQTQKLQLQMQKKCDAVYQKRVRLAKLSQKKINLAKIIQRNKNDPSLQYSKLTFPLITTTIQEQKMQILHHYSNFAIFRFPQAPILQADFDLLLNFKQASRNQQLLQPENIYNVIGKQEDYQRQPRKEIKFQSAVKGKVDFELEDL